MSSTAWLSQLLKMIPLFSESLKRNYTSLLSCVKYFCCSFRPLFIVIINGAMASIRSRAALVRKSSHPSLVSRSINSTIAPNQKMDSKEFFDARIFAFTNSCTVWSIEKIFIECQRGGIFYHALHHALAVGGSKNINAIVLSKQRHNFKLTILHSHIIL